MRINILNQKVEIIRILNQILTEDLLYFYNYISHLGVYKKSIVDEIGGFRVGFEGSQDYDLALRVISHSKKNKIIHIPIVLYH